MPPRRRTPELSPQQKLQAALPGLLGELALRYAETRQALRAERDIEVKTRDALRELKNGLMTFAGSALAVHWIGNAEPQFYSVDKSIEIPKDTYIIGNVQRVPRQEPRAGEFFVWLIPQAQENIIAYGAQLEGLEASVQTPRTRRS